MFVTNGPIYDTSVFTEKNGLVPYVVTGLQLIFIGHFNRLYDCDDISF